MGASTGHGWTPPYPLGAVLLFVPGGRARGFRPFADRLRSLGYDVRSQNRYLRADEDEVRRFQADERIHVDGIVGAQTWCAALTTRESR